MNANSQSAIISGNSRKNSHPSTLFAADLARLAGLSLVKAHAWLRQLPHVKVGRSRYTRPEWLAQWEVSMLKTPPVTKSFDPLEAAVADRAAWAVGELVRQGKLRLGPGFSDLGPEKLTEASVTRIDANSLELNPREFAKFA